MYRILNTLSSEEGVLKQFHVKGAMEISSSADVPSGTGLGSSSSYTVGLLHNMYVKSGMYATKETLADKACDIEINKLGEPIGKQDQYAAAFGGLNVIKFNTSGEVNVEPIHIRKSTNKQLQRNLMMFYVSNQRRASSILSEQKTNMDQSDKFENLKKMVELVMPLRDSLYSDDLEEFGAIMHKNWKLKQSLASGITNPMINDIYDKALQNGASGGKLLGAGAGGFLMFYCDESKHERLRSALAPYREMKFKFDNEGSKIIYVGDEYEEY